MITKIEADAKGTPLRIYHRAGLLTADGDKRPDEKFSWTHPYDERDDCDACRTGRIPKWLNTKEG